MRKFFSYGPLDTDLHYYVPRKELIDQALGQLVGENSDKGGHYITVWAPRQAGKTWVMQQVLASLRDEAQYGGFDVAKINLQVLKTEDNLDEVARYIAAGLARLLKKPIAAPDTLRDLEHVFTNGVLDKPLILILDEFDALSEQAISALAGVFRNIYIHRQDQSDKPTAEKDYLLHGVSLIGVRAVLGIENVSGSPFNVQRSVHIPNLTLNEVTEMFQWYERESGQKVEQAVVEKLFYETRGQPGLTGWFGELLTETYNQEIHHPITLENFEEVYAAALNVLPNSNILNIISKAKQEPYKQFVLEMFRTDETLAFKYDDAQVNFLYMNGVIDAEKVSRTKYQLRFACPFVQKRLFNYFSNELFRHMGQLHDPFENLDDTITQDTLHVKNLLRRYEAYFKKNRDWLLKDAPRKTDLRVFEAVYHFNLYLFLSEFLKSWGGRVYPEFPTGNGKIDLLIKHGGREYGVEIKTYTNQPNYRAALNKAAHYGQQLGLDEITLVFFVEQVDDANRARYEAVYQDEAGVTVVPVFVATSQ